MGEGDGARRRGGARLAEELVEAWLNRQGYFTIGGIKIGVHEIDLLAVKHPAAGTECRHVEVQGSMRLVGYISPVPAALRKTGRAAGSARRTKKGFVEGVAGGGGVPRGAALRIKAEIA